MKQFVFCVITFISLNTSNSNNFELQVKFSVVFLEQVV